MYFSSKQKSRDEYFGISGYYTVFKVLASSWVTVPPDIIMCPGSQNSGFWQSQEARWRKGKEKKEND